VEYDIKLYFSKQGKQVVLLLVGGDKSSQKKDIKLAKDFLEDYERMNKHGSSK